MTAPVSLPAVPTVCPHCLTRPRALAAHIQFECPVLEAKRAGLT